MDITVGGFQSLHLCGPIMHKHTKFDRNEQFVAELLQFKGQKFGAKMEILDLTKVDFQNSTAFREL